MVGSHDYKCFVGVLTVEVVCHRYCRIEIADFGGYCRSVVAVAFPVDISAFDHEKESIGSIFSEEVDAGAHNLRKTQVATTTVDGIWSGTAVDGRSFAVLEKYHPGCGRGCFLIGIVATHDGVAGAAGFVEQASGIGRSDAPEIGAAEKVETACREIAAYGIVVLTRFVMCIESSRSSMVDSHG